MKSTALYIVALVGLLIPSQWLTDDKKWSCTSKFLYHHWCNWLLLEIRKAEMDFVYSTPFSLHYILSAMQEWHRVPDGSFSTTSCLSTQVDLQYLLQNKEVLLPPFSHLQWKPRLFLRHSLTSLSYSEKPRIFHSVKMSNKSLPPLFFVYRELHAQYQHFLNTRRNLCNKISEKTTKISAV